MILNVSMILIIAAERPARAIIQGSLDQFMNLYLRTGIDSLLETIAIAGLQYAWMHKCCDSRMLLNGRVLTALNMNILERSLLFSGISEVS
jgi:hypothetical protein